MQELDPMVSYATALMEKHAASEKPARPEKRDTGNQTRGRPKGSMAKATVNRTVSFRSALTDEDWEDIAVVTYNRMMDPHTKNGDFVKLALFMARYNLVSADCQMVLDTEGDKLDPAMIDGLRALIKNEGMPKTFGKTSYVPS